MKKYVHSYSNSYSFLIAATAGKGQMQDLVAEFGGSPRLPEGFFQRVGRRFKAQGRFEAVAELGQRDVRPMVVFVDLAGTTDASLAAAAALVPSQLGGSDAELVHERQRVCGIRLVVIGGGNWQYCH